MTNNIFDKIQTRLWQDKQPVTARWVCYEYICQMAGAQDVLRECKDANKDKLSITWLIEGITASSGHREVRIVSESQAADVKLGLSEILSEQIYSLTPSVEVSDAGSLIAGDVEQARQMMSALLANNKSETDDRVEAFLHNGCSNVKGLPCVREPVQRKRKPAAQPTPVESKKPPLAKPKAASAPAAPATDKAAGQKDVGKQQPAVKAEPAKGAKGKSAAKNPLANSFSKSVGKKTSTKGASQSAGAACGSVKQEKKETAKAETKKEPEDAHMAGQDSEDDAPPAQAKAKLSKGSQQVLDDDEEDDDTADASPLPTKKPATKARQNVVLEDSDDDDFGADAKGDNNTASAEKKPLQMASKQQSSAAAKSSATVKAAPKKAASAAKSKPAHLDSDMENLGHVKSEPHTEKEETGGGAEAPAGSHPEYGAPPHPDAEIVMVGSKAVWQYINDKGEEVTEEAKKAGAAKPAAAKPQVPSKRAKPEPQEDSAQAAEEPKAAKKKKPASKHQKAAVQASDIRNLFGKKK